MHLVLISFRSPPPPPAINKLMTVYIQKQSVHLYQTTNHAKFIV